MLDIVGLKSGSYSTQSIAIRKISDSIFSCSTVHASPTFLSIFFPKFVLIYTHQFFMKIKAFLITVKKTFALLNISYIVSEVI